MIRDFEEYLREGVVTQRHPDTSRAVSLGKESEQSESMMQRIVEAFGINDENANTIIKMAYDAIMSRIRAKMLAQGYVAAGTGAHMAEVAYLRKLGFSERDVQFCDQLRYFRNGVLYYGKTFDTEYADKVMQFTKRLGQQLSQA